MLTAADHFGRREIDGIVVDLFWNRRNHEDQFRVEVEDEREGTRFVLHPRTGREAIQAFYHPFAAARVAALSSSSPADPWRRPQERRSKA